MIDLLAKATVDLQGPILSNIIFYTKFKTSTLSEFFQKKLFQKLKTRTSYPQKSKFLKLVNESQTMISHLICVNPQVEW